MSNLIKVALNGNAGSGNRIGDLSVASPDISSGFRKAVVTTTIRPPFDSHIRLQFDRATTIRRPTLQPTPTCVGCCTAAKIYKQIGQRDCS